MGYLNRWDTDLVPACKDLLELFKRTSGHWEPAGFGQDSSERFDSAIRRAYFDGIKIGHSLVSGLTLIESCRADDAKPEAGYEKKTALTACVIAALCMLFHDQHCRETLLSSQIPPIAFDQLPWASTLIIADALQHDRRDISQSIFREHGVLNGLEVDAVNRRVKATVCLKEAALQRWPFMIVEYDNALEWLNNSSDVRFEIDYRTKAQL
jgi:hypothetical protein